MPPRGHDGESEVVDLVGAHCDLVDRLRAVPPSASIRGVWFKVFLTELEELGLLAEYERYFPNESWSGLKFYWVGDYLTRIALAGALTTSPERVSEGMAVLNHGNAKRFAKSLLGKTLFRLLSNDPQRLLQQGVASRRQTMTYGRWLATFPSPTEAIVQIEEEYIWIDPNIVASAVGMYDAIGVRVTSHVHQSSKFDGTITFKIS